jgi:hypothetical protein
VFYLKVARAIDRPLYMREDDRVETLLVTRTPTRGSIRGDRLVRALSGRPARAYGVSLGGSEDSALRVLVATPRPLEIDAFQPPGVYPDSRSFTTRASRETRHPAQCQCAPLPPSTGRDASATTVFAPAWAGRAGVRLSSLHLPLESRTPTRSRAACAADRHWPAKDSAGVALAQAGAEDEILAIEGWKDDLYLLSKRNAPHHRVLRVKADAAITPRARWCPRATRSSSRWGSPATRSTCARCWAAWTGWSA